MPGTVRCLGDFDLLSKWCPIVVIIIMVLKTLLVWFEVEKYKTIRFYRGLYMLYISVCNPRLFISNAPDTQKRIGFPQLEAIYLVCLGKNEIISRIHEEQWEILRKNMTLQKCGCVFVIMLF